MSNGDKILVARHTAFQGILLTEDKSGLRTLRFGSDGAFQSVVKAGDPRHLALPYARLLPAGLAFHQNPRRMLIVGLGGGTLPRFFHSHFPEMMIDVVEIDQGVVEVAKEHCGFAEDARMRVHVDDGRDFIEASRGGYVSCHAHGRHRARVLRHLSRKPQIWPLHLHRLRAAALSVGCEV